MWRPVSLALGLASLLPASLIAQPANESQAGRSILVVPVMRPSMPPKLLGPKPLDIPDWAKRQGHNGSVIWHATVAADGALLGLTLEQSSGSAAIDEAAKRQIQGASFRPATDEEGRPSQGRAEAIFDYNRYNDANLGAIDTYLCADLVREFDWFKRAKVSAEPRIFRLQNIYMAAAISEYIRENPGATRPMIDSVRADYTRAWERAIKTCRRSPTKRLLEVVEQPQRFRSWTRAF